MNKVALVTGASRGIGRRIITEFAERGYIVAVHYNHSRESADTLLEGFQKKNINAMKFKADVSNSAEVSELLIAVIEQFGRIDAVVNNAASIADRTILKMTDVEWKSVIETDLTGSFFVLRESAKYMSRKRAGSIINISSIVGVRGNYGEANYASAKAGIIGLTKTAAKELGRFGITVNCVLPGFHITDMTSSVKEEYKNKVLAESVLNCTTSVDELSKFIVFLSELKSVSGQVFNFDSRII